MNIGELIRELEKLDPSLPVTRIFEDFPHDIRGIEIADACAPYSEKKEGAGYHYVSYAPETEETPVYKIAILR